MRKYDWDTFRETDAMEELFTRSYEGVPATPPAIKVGDKVRVCKARWVAEGRYAAVDERYLKEVSDDGVKFYVSMLPRCGKQYALEIGESLHRALVKYFNNDVETTHDFLKKRFTMPEEIKTIMNGEDTMKTVDLRVKNIIHNGPCTIVFWMDNTKTIVKLKPGDTYDPHAAFCIAVAKKMYGNNSKISKIVDQFSKDVKVPETPTRELSVEELKAAADKIGYRVSRKPKKK